MKTYREVIVNVLQKFLDDNVGDYEAIFTYLEKIEEENNK